MFMRHEKLTTYGVIRHRMSIFAGFACLAALLAAFHAPGQMSVDSGISLYEGVTGKAFGWGPTFFAAVLAWLGGGVVGASLFVGLNSIATFGCFAYLIAGRRVANGLGYGRIGLALLFALNPLFMFYVGIIWKDVMLATCSMVAFTMLFAAAANSGWRRNVLIVLALTAAASMPLLRQQGFLLSVPFSIAAMFLLFPAGKSALSARFGIVLLVVAYMLTAQFVWGQLSQRTIKPLQTSPISVGFLTIRAYDIVGMVAYAKPGDGSKWTGADAETIASIRALYSPERIDTLWHDQKIRTYLNSLDEQRSWSVWWSGISHDPVAYSSHRLNAFAALMGFESIHGCVPAYWGVAAVPEHLAALSLTEEMDPRDRLIGKYTGYLESSVVFRHWWYATMLLAASVFLLLRRKTSNNLAQPVLFAAAAAAWLYLLSYGPTTIACDYRYLFPVSCLATLIAISLLMGPVEAVSREAEVAG